MGGRDRALTFALTGAALLAACGGDPVLVLGDLPGTMRLVAGVPDTAGSRVEPSATASLLSRPRGLAVGDAGVVYIADFASRRVLSVSSDGALTVLSDGSGCPPGGCPRRPFHVALDGAGGLLVSDQEANRVWRLDLASGAMESLAGTGAFGTAPDGSVARESPLAAPVGVAALPDGSVYVAERGTHRVRRIGSDGRLTTVAGVGVAGYGGDGGPADEAALSGPTGLALLDGLLFITDTENSRVRAVDLATGTIETVAGSGVRAFGGDGGPALLAQLRRPEAVAATPDGRALFIADAGNNRVRRVDLVTGVITTFAGTGLADFEGTELAAGETALAEPGGVAASDLGLLFIADTEHHVVWRTTLRR